MLPAIKVERLSKEYRLGSAPGQRNLTETLLGAVKSVGGIFRPGRAKTAANNFKALTDVNFEVYPGEVVGIIGHNGAGKSTLLKILSGIVEPSGGRIEIRGRLGSLLEVGTGFHPELTGRENIFLNGSILGLSQREIAKNFDAIVEFADILPFIDTPVKRYSSGMYVRLAFAIASHLQPEILILDEVLAVGDAKFQKKCLGKMRDVADVGRTVLFVSHDLGAIRRLCSKSILLSRGRVVMTGPTEEVVSHYLAHEAQIIQAGQSFEISPNVARRGSGQAQFVSLAYHGDDNDTNAPLRTKGPMNLRLRIRADAPRVFDSLSVILSERSGFRLINADSFRLAREWTLQPGMNEIHMRIDSVMLQPDIYQMGLWLAKSPGGTFDFIEQLCEVEILNTLNDERPRPVNDSCVASDFDILSCQPVNS